MHVDVIILGAGAAGMMAAIEAGRRGRRVLIIDHAKAPGEKIRISGGGGVSEVQPPAYAAWNGVSRPGPLLDTERPGSAGSK